MSHKYESALNNSSSNEECSFNVNDVFDVDDELAANFEFSMRPPQCLSPNNRYHHSAEASIPSSVVQSSQEFLSPIDNDSDYVQSSQESHTETYVTHVTHVAYHPPRTHCNNCMRQFSESDNTCYNVMPHSHTKKTLLNGTLLDLLIVHLHNQNVMMKLFYVRNVQHI